MYAEKHTVSITVDATGNGTGYTPNVTGRLLTVQYAKANYADGVDITITTEISGLSLLTLTDQNASGVFHPRGQVHGVNGSGLTLTGNVNPIAEPFTIVNERIKVSVAQAGNGTIGNITLTVG